MPSFNIQSTLQSDNYLLLPLVEDDFDELYIVASDPLIWEQHPNRDRWQLDVFRTYFEGAILSKGAFKIIDKSSGKAIGSTRMYDFNVTQNSILIGYTFYAKAYWGSGANHLIKKIMLDYLFQYVDKVIFHIGAQNVRSQISITRLGATKTGEIEVAYHGEPVRLNYIYVISKNENLDV